MARHGGHSVPGFMLKSLVLWPHPALSKVAEPVTVFDDDLANLGSELIRVMTKYHGLGLSANQLADLRRVIVSLGPDRQPVVRVNPERTHESRHRLSDKEGCLSQPGKWYMVRRWSDVAVSYVDLSGQPQSVIASGLWARVLQHEIDHLNGINIGK